MKNYKETIKKSFIWGLVFAITAFWVVYAANITSVQSQTINSWDIMGKGWFQDVNDSIVPSWAVMAFYKSSCPNGWIAADWDNSTPDLRWSFIRWLNWDNNSRDSSRSLWSFQDDAIRNITWWDSWIRTWVSTSTSDYNKWAFFYNWGQWNGYTWNWNSIYYGMWINFDASRVVPTANDNRPKNIALLYCMKQ